MTISRNDMYDLLTLIKERAPDANLPLVAAGLGATQATTQDGIMLVIMPDGAGFAFAV